MRLFLIAFCTLLATALPSVAATPQLLPGYLDTKWGDSETSVRTSLLRNYRYLSPTKTLSDDENGLIFQGKVAGYQDCRIVANFFKGRLFEVQIAVPVTNDKTSFKVFLDLWGKLNKLYGDRTCSKEWDSSVPQEEQTNDNVIDFLNSGKVTMWVTWGFEDSNNILLQNVFDSSRPEVWIMYRSPGTKEASIDRSGL